MLMAKLGKKGGQARYFEFLSTLKWFLEKQKNYRFAKGVENAHGLDVSPQRWYGEPYAFG